MRSVRVLAALVVAVVLATAATTAPATAAARAGYVGIVVAGHGSYCVRWHSGLTGDEVLNDVAAVRYRPSDGLIDQIDGQPSPAHADDTHYWSYWHDTGGSWQYSGAGASGSQPAAGSVEGWSFVNGSSTASPPGVAPSGLYAALCGSRDAPPPRAHPTSKAASHAHRSAPRAKRPTTGAASTRGRSTRSGAAQVHSPGAATSGAAAATSDGRSSRNPKPAMSTPVARTPDAVPAGSGAAVVRGDYTPAAAAHTTSGSALPLILGIVLVLLLGSGAGWGVLRRRRADAEQ